MSKILFTCFSFLLLSAVSVRAQVNQHGADTVGRSKIDTPSIPLSQKVVTEQQLIKIKKTNLPTAIIKKLESNSYYNWQIQDAYKNIALNQYSVRLRKGNEIVFYTFDAKGDKIQD